MRLIFCLMAVATIMAYNSDSKDILHNIKETRNTLDVHHSGEDNKNNTEGFECMTKSNESYYRNGWQSEHFRWKHVVIFVDKIFDIKQRFLIHSAIKHLRQAVPCLKFTIWPFSLNTKPSGDYIHIVNGKDCSSEVGRIGGRQKLSLNIRSCMQKQIILHEMIHALGFDHEQCRPDRDLYVTVHEDNIRENFRYNFEKVSRKYFTSFGVPYNENSVMHYYPTAYTVNGQATITSKRNRTIGPSEDLQYTDVAKLRRMYNCF